MNKRIYYTLILIWILLLSILFIWNIWNVYWVVKICLSILIIITLSFLWYRRQYWNKSNGINKLHNFPISRRIILVVGDNLSKWIESGHPWRLFRDAMWVRVDNFSELIPIYQSLDSENKNPNGIMLILNPDNYVHVAALEQNISQWRQEIETIQGLYKRHIPVIFCIYTDLNDKKTLSWPNNIYNQVCRQRSDILDYFEQLQKRLDGLSMLPTTNEDYLPYSASSTIYLNHQWLQKFVTKNLLPEKAYPNSLTILSFVWVNSFTADEKADWRHFEIEKTGLVTPNNIDDSHGLLNFPKIESGLIKQYYLNQGSKYFFYAINWFCFFAIINTGYSFLQNKDWIQEIKAAHDQYIILPKDKENERLNSINKLKGIQQTLQDYQAYGEPNRMTFGLYHASMTLPIINKDINGFSLLKQEKKVIRLDSTALFDVGKSELKDDAKLVLQSVLTWIQANPNQRVLIDGYTDNTGDSNDNKRLSLERAQSVKNWLVTASTYPENHFTVQGYGDSNPIATNENTEGRSKNRRVEITLVDMKQRDEK